MLELWLQAIGTMLRCSKASLATRATPRPGWRSDSSTCTSTPQPSCSARASRAAKDSCSAKAEPP